MTAAGQIGSDWAPNWKERMREAMKPKSERKKPAPKKRSAKKPALSKKQKIEKAWKAVGAQSRLAKDALAKGDLGNAISLTMLGAYFLGKAHLLDGTDTPEASLSDFFANLNDALMHQTMEETISAAKDAQATAADRTLRELQSTLPWTVHYHRDFRASPMAHKDFGHALLHVNKASGKLAALVNDAEHGGCEFTAEQTDPYVADLVVCALRMANTCPGRVIDLQRAVVERIEVKNNTKLPRRRT